MSERSDGMVPRRMLDQANNAVLLLKKKLDETTQTGRREMDTALRSMQMQLKTLQAQNMTGEEQFVRSMEREKELRRKLEASEKAAEEARGFLKENVEIGQQIEAMSGLQEEAVRLKRQEQTLIEANKQLREDNAALMARLEAKEEQDGLPTPPAVGEESAANDRETVLAMEREVEALRYEVDTLRVRLLNEEEDRKRLVEKELQGEKARMEEEKQALADEVAAMAEERDVANNLLSTADDAARQNAGQSSELVKEVATHKRLLAELEADLHAERARRDATEATSAQLQGRLEQEQQAALSLQRLLEERDEMVRVLEDERGTEAKAQAQQLANAKERISELTRELEDRKGEISRVADDGKRSREGLRDELRRGEVELQELRERVRKEREVLERCQREHSEDLQTLNEGHSRALAVASKREEALQRRMEAAERQVEGLRGTCVPEEALRQAREEGQREKERLRSELEVVRGDMERERQRGVVLVERLEERLAAASEEAAGAIARCRSLQQQVRQTEKQSRRERRQREFAQEQIKALMGEDDADAKRSADVKPSKLALAASQRIDDVFERWFDEVQDKTRGGAPKFQVAEGEGQTHVSAAQVAEGEGQTHVSAAQVAEGEGQTHVSTAQVAEGEGQTHVSTAQVAEGEGQTALGIVLNDATVESTVTGTPAFACKQIEAGDEVVSVDGTTIIEKGNTVAMLRGNDQTGAVVTLVIKKASSGDVVSVRLPRVSIASVQARQDIDSEIQLLNAELIHSATLAAAATGGGVSDGEPGSHLVQRVKRINDMISSLDRHGVELALSMGQQVSMLRDGMLDLANRCKDTAVRVDGTHLEVHRVQEATERLLRIELARTHKAIMRKLDTEWDGEGEEGGAEVVETSLEEALGAEGRLHANIVELEGRMRDLQEESGALKILQREATENAERARGKQEQAESEVELFRAANAGLRASLQKAEDRLEEILAEEAEHCWCVGLSMSCNYDEFVRDSNARLVLDATLREELSICLEAPKGAISIVCYCRGGKGLLAVVRISTVIPPGGVGGLAAMRTGRSIAGDLIKQVEEDGELLRGGDYGAQITAANMMGPISERTAQAVRAALVDRERDARSFEGELQEAVSAITVVENGRASEVTELQTQQQQLVASFQSKMQQMAEGHSQELERRVEEEKKEAERVMEETTTALIERAEQEVNLVEERYQRRLAEADASLAAAREEAHNLTKKVLEMEEEVKGEQGRRDELSRAVRAAEHDRQKMADACDQVQHLLVPELCTCLTTLGNIDSEMGFLNSYHLRAITVAESGGEGSEHARSQVEKSHGLIWRDVSLLRSQLDALSKLSYIDPWVLSRQLQEANAAPMALSPNRPRSNAPGAPGGGAGGSLEVSRGGGISGEGGGLDESSVSRGGGVGGGEGVGGNVDDNDDSDDDEEEQGVVGGDWDGGSASQRDTSLISISGPSTAGKKARDGPATSGRVVPPSERSSSLSEVKLSIAQSLERVGLVSSTRITRASPYSKQIGASPYSKGLSEASTPGGGSGKPPAARTYDFVTGTPPKSTSKSGGAGAERMGISDAIRDASLVTPGALIRVSVDEARGLDLPGGGTTKEFFVCLSLHHQLSDTSLLYHAPSLDAPVGAYNLGAMVRPQGRSHASLNSPCPKWGLEVELSQVHILFPAVKDVAERAQVWGQRAQNLVSLDGRAPVTVHLTLHELDAEGDHLGRLDVRLKANMAMTEWYPLLDASGQPLIGSAGEKAEVKMSLSYATSTSSP